MTDPYLTLLVDTNMWLDYFLGRKGAKDATAFIQCSLDHEDAITVNLGIMKDVFYLVGATVKRRAREEKGKVDEATSRVANDLAWTCLSKIQGLAVVLNLGFAEHLEASALRLKNPDYEDDLLLATAKNLKADYIITGDKSLLTNDVAPALTPAEYVAMRR